MSVAEAIAAILSAAVPLLVALGLLWWAYRRGEAAGAEKARREALEQVVGEIRAELASIQAKRRRGLRLPKPSLALLFSRICDLFCRSGAFC